MRRSTNSPEDRRRRFEQLYAEHVRAVLLYCRRRADAEIADDVTGETFLVAWRRLGEVPQDARPWLLGVARRTLANHRRGDLRRRALHARLTVEATPWIGGDPAESVQSDAVRAAIAALPEHEREAIALVHWDGLSTDPAGPSPSRAASPRCRARDRRARPDAGLHPRARRLTMTVTDAMAAADPARDLDPEPGEALVRARIDAIVAEASMPEGRPRRRARALRAAAATVTVAALLTAAGLALRDDDRGSTHLPGTAAAFARQFERPHGILHFAIAGGGTEGWVALDGSGYRQRFRAPDGRFRDDTMDARGDQQRRTTTGKLLTFAAEHPMSPDERLGNLDIGTFIQHLITGQQLEDAGVAEVDGRPVRRLVLRQGDSWRADYYVTPDGHRLVRASLWARNPHFPDDPGDTLTTDFSSFEVLPDTPANRALITLPPG
jgi:RNA polymerase sigma-70 factor (ECF subfamily)